MRACACVRACILPFALTETPLPSPHPLPQSRRAAAAARPAARGPAPPAAVSINEVASVAGIASEIASVAGVMCAITLVVSRGLEGRLGWGAERSAPGGGGEGGGRARRLGGAAWRDIKKPTSSHLFHFSLSPQGLAVGFVLLRVEAYAEENEV